jgi:hydrogenase maturation factor
MGAEPVGVLATLLFPAGVTLSTVGQLTSEIDATARALNVEVLGGHTEVAPGLATPLVMMTGVGKARQERLTTAAGGKPGDALVLTKSAGLEGTHVLASDLAHRLSAVAPEVLDQARAFGDELSVVPEARVALDLGATAMHDPTEGGVLGAVWEMAEASQCGVRVERSAIPVRPATLAVCAALGADPLRLIASGALLIACSDATRMVSGLRSAGIVATTIGQLTDTPERILFEPDGREQPISAPGRDELYRLLDESA